MNVVTVQDLVQELKLDGISYITVDDICQATKISIKRLNNLINPNTKTTIKIRELYYISYVLGVSINKLVNKEN